MKTFTDAEILSKASKILEKRAKYNTREGSFTSPEAVRDYCRLRFAAMEDGAEHFMVLYLDTRNRLIAAEVPFHGTVDGATVYPREVLKRALHHNANAVIFAHNHPSGLADVSPADKTLTRKLKKGLELFDIRVLDHMIVADRSDTILSMAEKGYL